MGIKQIKCRNKDTGEEFFLPLLEMDDDADYKWQLSALKSRIEHPEWYEQEEDIEKEIAKIKKWLSEHTPTNAIGGVA